MKINCNQVPALPSSHERNFRPLQHPCSGLLRSFFNLSLHSRASRYLLRRICLSAAGLMLVAVSTGWAATFTPTTLGDPPVTGGVSGTGVISGGAGNGQVSLRSAVIAANNAGGTNNVNLGSGIYQLTIPGTGETASSGDATIGDLDVLAPASGRNTLTVQGAGAASTTIQQTTGIDRIFDVHPVNLAGSNTFSLSGVTVKGGNITSASGGAMVTGRPGDITNLANCVFDGNTAPGLGGAISQSSGSASHDLTITNCVFKNNTATSGSGGAVNYSGLGTLTITGSTFSNNVSGSASGAVNLTGTGAGGTGNISTSNFFNNTSNDTVVGGGAIGGVQGQSLNIHFCRFIGNLAPNVTPGATTGKIIAFGGGSLSTANVFVNQNWWGANSGPAAFDVSQIVPTQWLQLRASASPNPIVTNAAATVTADILGQNTGGPTAAANLAGLPAFPATPTTIFSTPVLGSISAGGTQFVNGQATAIFTAGAVAGAGSANAAVDNGTATATLTIISEADRIFADGFDGP